MVFTIKESWSQNVRTVTGAEAMHKYSTAQLCSLVLFLGGLNPTNLCSSCNFLRRLLCIVCNTLMIVVVDSCEQHVASAGRTWKASSLATQRALSLGDQNWRGNSQAQLNATCSAELSQPPARQLKQVRAGHLTENPTCRDLHVRLGDAEFFIVLLLHHPNLNPAGIKCGYRLLETLHVLLLHLHTSRVTGTDQRLQTLSDRLSKVRNHKSESERVKY
ncbi:hypothetical protein Q8A73_018112 [Channa argus]|nr:hypothetical protein Q8A73_018112 [Channa argus]